MNISAQMRVNDYLKRNRANAKEVAINCDVPEAYAQKYIDEVAKQWFGPAPPKTPHPETTRGYNIGDSDYSTRNIQPWDIWLEYRLNPWDADIVKRVLRKKPEQRRLDYEKIKHDCDERIRQIDEGIDDVNMERKTSAATKEQNT